MKYRRSLERLLDPAVSRYLSSRSEDQTVVEGEIFRTTEGKTIINYPKRHSDNLTAKHQTTNSWFKPTVRVYKNMRNRPRAPNPCGADGVQVHEREQSNY